MLNFLKGAWDAVVENNMEKYKRTIKRHSLSCNRCNTLAVPVFGTSGNYECLGCGKRFTNKNHRIQSGMPNMSEKLYLQLCEEMKREGT